VARRPPSHILWNIKWPLLAIMVETATIGIWEYYAHNGFLPKLDSENVMKDLFRLVSFAMSLLLAFRLQRSYDRWNLARQSISGVVGSSVVTAVYCAWGSQPLHPWGSMKRPLCKQA
jgi:hypothetical protein